MSGHGGKRPGAGRPRKWPFEVLLTVGQACENRWRDEVRRAFDAASAKLFGSDADLVSLWEAAQNVPMGERRAWLASEDGEMHRADVEVELDALAGSDGPEGGSSRIVAISSKPPRGTRKHIIASVASQFALQQTEVDNLWQAYRRFERSNQKS